MEEETLKQFTTALADAIRDRDGTTDPINPQDFVEKILALPSTNAVPQVEEVRTFSDATKPASIWGGSWGEIQQEAIIDDAESSNFAETVSLSSFMSFNGYYSPFRQTLVKQNNMYYGKVALSVSSENDGGQIGTHNFSFVGDIFTEALMQTPTYGNFFLGISIQDDKTIRITKKESGVDKIPSGSVITFSFVVPISATSKYTLHKWRKIS